MTRTPNRPARISVASSDRRVFARADKIAAPVKAGVNAYAPPRAFDRWKAGVQAADPKGATTITIYDVIGEDFWSGGGVTVNRIDAALRQIGDQPVEVHINSPGGDMFEGIAIYNRLLEHPQPINVKVMGLAASAASVIAMAGDKIEMGPASFLMIHNCWVVAVGDRNDMAETASFLEPFDDAMAGVYAQRSGQDKAAVVKMLDAETWMSGSQALEKGFADALLGADAMQEDETATAAARGFNELRANELGLVRAGLDKDEARERTKKISGWVEAHPEPASAGPPDWFAAAASFATALRG